MKQLPIKPTRILGTVLVMATMASPAGAALYLINGDLADAEAENASVGNQISDAGPGSAVSNATKNGPLLAGFFNQTGISPVFPFQLPTLASGETIVSVTLTYGAVAFNNAGSGLDIYAIPYRSAASVVANDYFTGTLDTTNATLIQDNANVGGITLSGYDTLVAFLNSQYDNGADGGDFVFLRFSSDFTTIPGGTGSRGFRIQSQETGTLMTLSITTDAIPEPSSSVLLGAFGALALVLRKRR